jgi:protein disulfide-isomerase
MPRTVLVGALLLVLAGCGGPARSAEDAAPVRAPSPALPGADVSATPTATATATGSASSSPYDPTRDAAADVAAALHQAGADGRPVLLDFGAAWCPDCVALVHTFATDAVRPVLAGFHLVEIDVGKFDRNAGLAARYGIEFRTSGIPALAALAPDGHLLGTTADGSFAEARSLTPDQVADRLRQWQRSDT